VLGVLFVISFCVFNFRFWVPLLARNAGGLAALALLMGDRRRFDRWRSTLASTIDMKASTL